jgi:hypothetical protein
MLRNTTLDWCHNYMLEFPNYIFSKLIEAFCKHHWKTQNDKKLYMELKNMKRKETKRVEVYYEHIQNMVHGLRVLTIDNFLTIVFKASLQSYLKIVITWMKWSTFQQDKEATMLCEEGMTTAKVKNALLVPQSLVMTFFILHIKIL